MKLNREELNYIIETLVNRADAVQFALASGFVNLVDRSKLDKQVDLSNSIIEKLTEEKERLLNEED